MIDLAILGLLDEQDLHGYELKKRLAELVGSRSGVSFGSLYPALARLEKAGAVKAVEAHTGDDDAIPMTGALSGELAAFRARLGRPVKSRRTKKVYGITDIGRQRLRELLLDDRTDDRTFTVQVAFCQSLLLRRAPRAVRTTQGRAGPAPGRTVASHRRTHRHLSPLAARARHPDPHPRPHLDRRAHRRHPGRGRCNG